MYITTQLKGRKIPGIHGCKGVISVIPGRSRTVGAALEDEAPAPPTKPVAVGVEIENGVKFGAPASVDWAPIVAYLWSADTLTLAPRTDPLTVVEITASYPVAPALKNGGVSPI